MKLYSTPDCPQCKRIKSLIEKSGKPFEELDLRDPDNLTDLRCSGIFSISAPVLVISETPLRYLGAGHISASSDETLLDIIR